MSIARAGDEGCGTTVPLPTPPSGWFDDRYAILHDGTLAIARTKRDLFDEDRRWLADEPGYEDLPRYDGTIQLATFDGDRETIACEIAAGGRVPKFSRFPNGNWLIVESRCGVGERNARVFADDGAPVASFVLGDGIGHVLCAANATVWVGYFDEGIFSPRNVERSVDAPSRHGVAQFDADGRVRWTYPYDANPSGYNLAISECYALAVADAVTWLCPMTSPGEFPIVRIANGERRSWRNTRIQWAGAIASDGRFIILASGLRRGEGRLSLLELDGDDARPVYAETMALGPPRRLLHGQGSTIHTVRDGVWNRRTVAEMVDAMHARRG